MDTHRKDTLEAVRRQISELERQIHEIKVELWPEDPAPKQGLSYLVSEEKIRKLLKARRLREQQLGQDLFADPAWDILLEAFAASLGQRRVAITALCQASSLPVATGLRWIGKLEEGGWLERRPDPFDGRRHWIELTAHAHTKLQGFFQIALPTVLPLCAASDTPLK
ncbi:MAG TPA: hypothetical protein VFQ33_01625 [Xanthobacteraceae bacterium]|nr:hypothetical protein [Xanthobacteraceae bacterium]